MTNTQKKARRLIAYCWQTGQIEFGQSTPSGAIPLLSGPARRVRRIVTARARMAYDNRTLLVPGVPEARGMAALDAACKFATAAQETLKREIR